MKITIKEMSLVSIFTALTALGAFISLPLGPVPITLQSLFVLLSGILLGPKLAALSQIVYIVLALVGIPIFSGFSGGPQIILKPSFGFALGFVFAAYIMGKIIHQNPKSPKLWMAASIGSIIIYLFGLPYMYFILNFVMEMNLSLMEVFKIGCLLFIPGDILKLITAIFIGKRTMGIMKGIIDDKNHLNYI